MFYWSAWQRAALAAVMLSLLWTLTLWAMR